MNKNYKVLIFLSVFLNLFTIQKIYAQNPIDPMSIPTEPAPKLVPENKENKNNSNDEINPDPIFKSNSPPSPPASKSFISSASLLSKMEFWLSLSLVFLGLAVFYTQYKIVYHHLDKEKNPENITRIVESALKHLLMGLIIFGTLFLVSAGISSESIAPIIGLLGTIAGYLLGNSTEPKPATPSAQEAPTVQVPPAAPATPTVQVPPESP